MWVVVSPRFHAQPTRRERVNSAQSNPCYSCLHSFWSLCALVKRSPIGPMVTVLHQVQTGGFLSYKNPGLIKDILKNSQNECNISLKSRYDLIIKAIIINWIKKV